MKLLKTYKGKNYPINIQVTKGRRAVYYKEGKTPKKLTAHLGSLFIYDDKGILCDMFTGKKIIKNEKLIDKPRYIKVNGQKLHQLTEKTYHRSKIIKAIKEWTLDIIKNQGAIDKSYSNSKIWVEFIYYTSHNLMNNPSMKIRKDLTSDNDGFIDMDNHSLYYTKAILDCFGQKLTLDFGEKVDNPLGFLVSDNYLTVKKFSVEHKEVDIPDRHDLKINIYEIC